MAVHLARTGSSEGEIRTYIERTFDYDLSETLDSIRDWYRFDSTCPGSVRHAIIAFLASVDYEDAIRKAISIGGDSDTIACMAGGIDHAFYGAIPPHITEEVWRRLDDRLTGIVQRFMERFEVVA